MDGDMFNDMWTALKAVLWFAVIAAIAMPVMIGVIIFLLVK